MPGVRHKSALDWRVLTIFASLLAPASGENFVAYRLRLARGSKPPADPYSPVEVGGWQVSEITFHDDAACQSPLTIKKPIASAGASQAALAFDGNGFTKWRDACVRDEDPIDQCKNSFIRGAWIGAELHSPSDVLCVSLDQEAVVDGLVLDGWSASNMKWLAVQEFVHAPKEIGGAVQLRRLRGGACTKNIALGTGEVLIPSCVSGSQWRFTAAEATKSWDVFELELHRDLKCRDEATDGVPMTSDDRPEPARRLHDGLLSTAWAASCTEGAGEGLCDKNKLWVGSSFPVPEEINCIRVYQSYEAVDDGPRRFLLSVWDGTSWVLNQEFPAVGNGVWSYLSPQVQTKSSRWRIVNNAKSDRAWSVHDLAFMQDSMCSQRIPGGLPLSSTVDGAKAFDDNIETVWVSQCSPCEPSSAYLGQSFEVPVLVRCVHLWQSGDTDYMMNSVALETWDNSSDVFDWRQIRVFKRLEVGLNQLSPWWDASGTRFKLVNLNEAPGGWRVAELRLFSDADCFERVSGLPFGSDQDPADADRAFDADVSTFWHASCCSKLSTDTACLGCDGIGASVGLISIENTSVNCLQIIQKGQPQPRGPVKFATTSLSLQSWTGMEYETIYEWNDIPGDEWVQLMVGVDNFKDSISCVDNREWELCNVSGYNCSRYRAEEMCNTTYQSDIDCGGIEMSFACKESCCLCGEANSDHCPAGALEDAGLPAWLLPMMAGLGSVCCLSCCSCCGLWKKRVCHHRAGCRRCCNVLDRFMPLLFCQKPGLASAGED